MKRKFTDFIIALSLIIGVVLGTGVVQQAFAATTLRFVETPTITLYSSISASATSMRVTPYPKDLNGTKLTMTDFGSSTTLTVDPKVKNIEEIIGFTGITDNGDNTATLTGLTRNLTSKYPYTTVGTGRQHSASAIVVFSNNPQMYNRLAAKENDEAIGGNWTFGGLNIFSATTTLLADCNTASANTQICAKAYIDTHGGPGAANANDTTAGLVQTATGAQAAAGTSLGSTGARLALGANLATSTPGLSTATGNIITATGRYLAQSWLDLTAAFTFSTTTTYIGNFGKLTATTSAQLPQTVTFGTTALTFPASQCVSGQVLQNNGSGTLSCVYAHPFALANLSATAALATFATSSALNIPAGALTASSTITINGNIECSTTATVACTWYVRDTSGNTLFTFTASPATADLLGPVNITINGTTATAQAACANAYLIPTGGGSPTTAGKIQTCSTGAVTIANVTGIVLVASGVNSGGQSTASWGTSAIIINP